MGGSSKKRVVDYFEVLSILYLLAVVLFVLIVAGMGDHSIFLVLVGFFPAILTIIISLLLHEQYDRKKGFLWIVPIIICAVFYFLGKSSMLMSSFDIDVLTGVNFVISLVYVMVVFMIFSKTQPKEESENEQKESIIQTQALPEKKTLQEYIHSIEDKSKALNFVIGRVYSKFHGGTDKIREKLRIPADWYNDFSLIGLGTDSIDKDKLLEIVNKFERHLKKFEKTENELFKDDVQNFKNLIHEVDGSDKIIDVMDRNDKDPVRSYYEGAVDFCQKIKEELESDNLTLIKNEYVPKTPEEEDEIRERQGDVDEQDFNADQEVEKNNNHEKKSRKPPKEPQNKKDDYREPPYYHP